MLMDTGPMPSVTKNLNVGAENKKMIAVNGPDMSSQSHSRSRGGRMDLDNGEVRPMKPSNRDQYQ